MDFLMPVQRVEAPRASHIQAEKSLRTLVTTLLCEYWDGSVCFLEVNLIRSKFMLCRLSTGGCFLFIRFQFSCRSSD